MLRRITCCIKTYWMDAVAIGTLLLSIVAIAASAAVSQAAITYNTVFTLPDGSKAFFARVGDVPVMYILDGNKVRCFRECTDQPPDPGPQPVPDSPITKLVREKSKGLSADLKQAVRGVFLAVADEIAAGKYKTADEIIKATFTRNQEVYNKFPNANVQVAELRNVLGKTLDEMAANGELKSMEDHIRVWRDIAKGLE